MKSVNTKEASLTRVITCLENVLGVQKTFPDLRERLTRMEESIEQCKGSVNAIDVEETLQYNGN